MSPTGTGLLVGSLFTGYGGLDMAVAQVFPAARLAWVCEHEPATPKNRKPSNAAARVLAHRHPDVPNLGDITQQDWRTIRRVHILTGGYPCQPDSDAGLKLGEHDDRWLWPEYLKAIRALRPRWAIGENVRGHVQRGLRSVVADLQAEGYAVVWTTISASDVGACHAKITNKQAIRMCGNGVVPQQAAAALRLLLGHVPGRSM